MKGTKSEPSYKTIDRKRESQLVLEWQRTGDEATLMRVYRPRVETLKFMAQKYYYLCEDMESEMREVFMRAISKYGRAKQAKSFNTYLYTSCINHIRNMAKSKSRNKRTNIDGVDPEPFFLRLDDTVSICDDGGTTYHDLVEGPDSCFQKAELREFMRIVEARSWVLLDVMLDTAASGIKCINRRRYDRSIPHSADLDPKDAVARDVGLPAAFYRIETCEVRDGTLHYEITVSGRKASEMLGDMLEELGEG